MRISGKEVGRVEMKGGTIQGSLSGPVSFMLVLEEVLEKMRKEKLVGWMG